MAIEYTGMANSPCCIIRSFSAEAEDEKESVYLRVGGENCPLPTGWTFGTPVNVPFFERLKAASRLLTGAQTDEQLSAASIPAIFFYLQAGQSAWEAQLQSVFPDGRLLELPLVESVTNSFGPAAGVPAAFQAMAFAYLDFEDNGDEAPRYADFRIGLEPKDQAIITAMTIKLFHSLTA